MIESPHSRYSLLDLPVYSLYSETRQPLPEMLNGLDCFLIDLQDIGTRVYTFAWTVMHCLEACAEAQIPVVLLDRPNPLGGIVTEGPCLEPAYRSFVGRECIPMRHALTLGELALFINRRATIQAELQVVPMRDWQRSYLWCDLERTWLPPSPNLPRFESALLYPGQVLLEGTNISEGRGTTLPFEIIGAPFLSSGSLLEKIPEDLPGIKLMATRFVPTFDKWQAESCEGLAIRVLEPRAVRSFELTIRLLHAIASNWPEDFQCLPPPYEYETEKMPLDILYGSSRLRETLGNPEPSDIGPLLHTGDEWWGRVRDVLLY